VNTTSSAEYLVNCLGLSSSILIISAITLLRSFASRVYAEVPFFHAASYPALLSGDGPGPFHPYVLCFPARLSVPRLIALAACPNSECTFTIVPTSAFRTATKTFFGRSI